MTASIIPSDLGIRGIVDAHLGTKPAETRAWDSYTEAHREADRADEEDAPPDAYEVADALEVLDVERGVAA